MSKHSRTRIVRSTTAHAGHELVCDHPEDLSARPGPVWLFVHGIAVCSAFWAPLMPPTFRDRAAWLSASLPVHAPSRGPDGFGPDDVGPELFTGVLGAALDTVAAGRDVVVVGHSTGGFAGLCLALARPEQVVGVVLVGGFADGRWTGLEGDMQLMAQRRRYGPLGPAILRLTSRLTTRWPWLHLKTAAVFAHDKRTFLTDGPTREAFRLLREDARDQDEAQLIAFFAGIREVDVWDRVRDVRQPVLVLDGEHDPVIPRAKTERLAGELPGGELLLYEGTGHMVMNERRERFWADVLAWGSAVTAGAGRRAAS